jgi:hypothetical protein
MSARRQTTKSEDVPMHTMMTHEEVEVYLHRIENSGLDGG